MDSRERILTALAHKEADRTPFNFTLTWGEMRERFKKDFGTADYEKHYGHDIKYVDVAIQINKEQGSDKAHVPRVPEETMARCIKETNELHSQGYAVSSEYESSIYEKLKHWYGDVDTLLMPYEQPELLEKEIRRLVDWRKDVFGAYAKIGVDILWMGDDLGTQKDLVMNPEQYRQWYKSAHAEIIKHIKSVNPKVCVALHSCGNVTKLLPDFIDIGLDVLQAVQPECMDIAFLKKEYGRNISFWGGVGAQSELVHGKPEDVSRVVKKTLEIMSPGGGYILAPAHRLTPDVSWENIKAFCDAAKNK